jgi:hypothetical protein
MIRETISNMITRRFGSLITCFTIISGKVILVSFLASIT